jgi:hypothetical protein
MENKRGDKIGLKRKRLGQMDPGFVEIQQLTGLSHVESGEEVQRAVANIRDKQVCTT